jgi:hypothetical protein
MRRVALALTLILAGCHAHTGVGFATGTPGALAPASASVSVHAGPALGALIGLGIIAAAAREDWETTERLAPPLDATRRVAAQDCSRPIEDPSANLRCR